MAEIWAAAAATAATVGSTAYAASSSGKGGGGGGGTQTTQSTQTPTYGPLAMPFFQKEGELATNFLFPLEGSVQKPMQRLLNPDNEKLPWETGPDIQAMNLAGQVADKMPWSTTAQSFVDDVPRTNMLNLRAQLPNMMATWNKNLISPGFSGMLAPRGSTTIQSTK